MKRIWLSNIILLIVAIIMSLILKLSHMPLSFMFGPIIVSIIVVKMLKLNIRWPLWISQIGLILLGIRIGSTFTSQVINDIKNEWLTIVTVTVLLITLSLLIAYFFRKIVRVNTETAILSVIPDALNRMSIMAEEDREANTLVISLAQTSRVISVVILIPLTSFLFSNSPSSEEMIHKATPLTRALNVPRIALIVIAIASVYFLMSKVNFSTKQLLAPVVVLVVWNLSAHLIFTLGNYILAFAQVIYIIRIDLQIAHLLGDLKGRIAMAITYQNISLVLGSFLMVFIVRLFTYNSLNGLFLGGAPGGMSQIVLVAIATGAGVAKTSSFYIFRIFFILFLVALIINYFLKRKRSDSQS